MQYSKDNKCSANIVIVRVIVSLDSLPQIFVVSMSGIFIFKINSLHFPSLSLTFWKT